MLSVSEIKDFFLLESSHAKKELGQNFLINEEVISNICNALEIKDSDTVLEIGPGLGSLTDELVKKTHNLTLVEYDAKFYNFLCKCHEDKGITIVKSNILHFKDYSMNKVIGNLPYYITSDILEFIAKNYRNLEKGVFMIQLEALKRICAKNGKDYNALNLLLMYKYDIKELFRVKKNNFFPEPNVDSVVFSITPKANMDFGFGNTLYKVSKILFTNRRKTIQNNLKTVIKDKETMDKVLSEASLEATLRAEDLSLENYIKLTEVLINNSLIKKED